MKIKVVLFCLFFVVKTNLVSGQPFEGYTFYAPQNGNQAKLVELSGSVYHSWSFPNNKKTCYSSYLLPGGSILRSVNHIGNYFNGGPIGGEVQIVDWNGTVIWDFVYSTQEYCSHHDIHMMPNGNVLLIAYELKTTSEVIQAGCSQGIVMWPDKIVEIEPSGSTGGTVVWEWHAWDHLCQNYDPSKDNYVTSISEHPELLNINYNTTKDWMHMNGIDYNETLDQITFSSHNLNEIYVIDHSTTTEEASGHTGGNSGMGGDLIYRWGNPAAYQTSGATVFNVVHDAHWVPADCPPFAGRLAAYNNKGGSNGKTCVDIFDPPYDGYNYSHIPGTAYEPATWLWRTTYPGNTAQNNGNSQQLPNCNVLVTIGLSGYIYEVDSNQNVVWSHDAGAVIAQSFRYTADYIAGISGIQENSSLVSIYPNPASGLLHIDFSPSMQACGRIIIRDIFGQIVRELESDGLINLRELDDGMYFLSVATMNSGIITRKVVIRK